MSYYLHALPGRLRVRTPLIKGKQEMVADVHDILRSVCGITSVTVNPITGSVVVTYDTKAVRSEEIINILKGAGYFDPSKAVTNDQYMHAKASTVGKIIKKAVLGVVIEKALEHSAISLIAALI